jgi:hypothetical protein
VTPTFLISFCPDSHSQDILENIRTIVKYLSNVLVTAAKAATDHQNRDTKGMAQAIADLLGDFDVISRPTARGRKRKVGFGWLDVGHSAGGGLIVAISSESHPRNSCRGPLSCTCGVTSQGMIFGRVRQ